MRILGVSAFYHDSAAALIEDGRIVAAAQEERFSRVKHDARFPASAIDYCLAAAGVEAKDIDHVAFYDKPFVKFERLLETYMSFAPRGFQSFATALPVWLRDKLFQKSLLAQKLKHHAPNVDWRARLLFAEHHLSHAASAFYPSPFDEAVVLTMDGVGEWATTSVAFGDGAKLAMQRELRFPHSLGLLYSAFTYYTGFKVNSGEYKLMGLAPYGEPKYASLILDHIVDLKKDGTFRLDQSYFDYCTGLRMTSEKLHRLFGGPPRAPEEQLTQRHMDIAASIQAVTEEIVLRLTRALAAETGARNLCLAGGVALNCVANGKVLRDKSFERIWIQPAAGDAGGALGAALLAYHGFNGRPRAACGEGDAMQGAYLGPSYSQSDIERRLADCGARFTTLSDEETIAATARDLADGRAVGWFQGRMEFGPRALGGRSILADPRSPQMQRTLNLKVKYRESFRPFAPSVLREHVADWFDLDEDSPYMLLVADVATKHRLTTRAEDEALFGIERLQRPRSVIPAVTHVDCSARVQTVHEETNPRYHALISAFHALTGCPVLVNTSFNVRGEPIVCKPEDAFACFMGTEIETLVIGNCHLRKEDQDPALRKDYKDRFELD
ncbi:carbamoyltransferase [Methylosinus sp. C49]|uniref:carbamoyltransferase family protein n=1 Tax=Methylosinus sp. C49 TaxID=2699395 RepID=UPI0013670065|nr:carbamoyltransferase [Methylosinus sp. C49]BBU62992.1 carbamoyltransferase [Methylosinus sp. C49]